MKCIVVDDEPLAVDMVCSYIDKIDDLEIVATTNSPVEAISILQENEVDLVFLDIEMPNLTGLDLVKSTPNLPQFIFTTAYPKYALDGFELNATDYLVKPISFARFIKAVSKARELNDLKANSSNSRITNPNDFIFVKSEYENVKIKTQDIIYVEGLKDYIKIHIRGSKKSILTLMSFKAMVEKLPEKKFIRIHRSYIVNTDYISSLKKNRISISDQYLPVSETYKEDLLFRLGI